MILSGPRAGTLIRAGDVVVVHDRNGALSVRRIDRGAGRSGIRFMTTRLDGHLYAIPSDAQRLLGQDRLDERMFDITQLLKWGYDDAHQNAVPLLAQRKASGAPTALKGATVTRSIPAAKVDALRLDKAKTGPFWKELTGARTAGDLGGGVAKLWLDGERTALLDKSVPQIGAPAAWEKGLTGKGVTVAILDGGYDARHPDLKDVVTEATTRLASSRHRCAASPQPDQLFFQTLSGPIGNGLVHPGQQLARQLSTASTD